jgi:(1->4)-alpha-D-glucan 1-alpha-D-glucosylmutase
LRLVDPDNRGPVDFSKRIEMLSQLHTSADRDCAQPVQCLLEKWRDSRVKLHVLARSLRARRENPELFTDGDYRPLEVTGDNSSRVIAFARTHGDDCVAAVVPRCVASIEAPVVERERRKFWQNTFLVLPDHAPGQWHNALADRNSPAVSGSGRVSLGDVFEGFPVALLVPDRNTR